MCALHQSLFIQCLQWERRKWWEKWNRNWRWSLDVDLCIEKWLCFCVLKLELTFQVYARSALLLLLANRLPIDWIRREIQWISLASAFVNFLVFPVSIEMIISDGKTITRWKNCLSMIHLVVHIFTLPNQAEARRVINNASRIWLFEKIICF